MTMQLSVFGIVLCVFMLLNVIEVHSIPVDSKPAPDTPQATPIIDTNTTDANNPNNSSRPHPFTLSEIPESQRSPSASFKYIPSAGSRPVKEILFPTNGGKGTVTEFGGNNPQTVVATSSRPTVEQSCGVHIKPKENIDATQSNHIRIAGGRAAGKDKWPWMAALLLDGNHQYCGGSLITDQHILTASHCVKNITAAGVKVRLGEYNFLKVDGREKDFEVEEIIMHPQFNSITLMHDIAVLKLKKTTDFTNSISPICLPSDGLDLEDKNSHIAGWGRTSNNGSPSDVLLEARVPVWNNAMCLATYTRSNPSFNTDYLLCAGLREGGTDSCAGDSGGPLMYQENGRWTVAGIVSWGYGCAEAGNPGVYGRVSPYVPWIQSVISPAPFPALTESLENNSMSSQPTSTTTDSSNEEEPQDII